MERSRTGCATCRKRKRKCDEGRPGCRACAARGVECGGYELELRWGNAVASRGHLAGASTPVRPPPPPKAKEPSALSHQQLHSHGQLPQHQRPESDATASPPVTSPPQGPTASVTSWGSSPSGSTPRGGPDVEPSFEKFLQVGLRQLYASSAETWVEPMFRELSLDSLALTTAGVAMQTYIDEGRNAKTLHEITRTIRTLREELHERRDALSASTMCACLLVCSLQLFEGEPWTNYLKLITDLYNLGGSLNNLNPDPQFDHSLRCQLEVLAMMDISFLVLGRLSPSVGLWTRFRKQQDSWSGGRLKGYEPVSGLSRSLLDLMARSDEQQDDAMEQELWLWYPEPGQLLQCQLWDAARYAAILRVRRYRHYSAVKAGSPRAAVSLLATAANHLVPASEFILFRLLSNLEALLNGIERPENHNLLSAHSYLFAMTEASLMAATLRQYKDWARMLTRLRAISVNFDGTTPKVTKTLCSLLREAWETGQDFFDIDNATRARGLELAVF